MGVYSDHVMPHLVAAGCAAGPIRAHRAALLPAAHGRVVEVGVGAGANLPFYDRGRVSAVIGVEPSALMRRKAERAAAADGAGAEILEGVAEALPVDDGFADTAVVTFTLCTVTDVAASLAEIRRVLAPGGRLLFCEHGRAPDARVRRTQRWMGPAWRRIAGGCRLDRNIPALLTAGGFEIEGMDAAYMPKSPRFAGYVYRGQARPR